LCNIFVTIIDKRENICSGNNTHASSSQIVKFVVTREENLFGGQDPEERRNLAHEMGDKVKRLMDLAQALIPDIIPPRYAYIYIILSYEDC
jgi:translation initiation factor 2B subunit (eIF-2B alpha/beta/delta family)